MDAVYSQREGALVRCTIILTQQAGRLLSRSLSHGQRTFNRSQSHALHGAQKRHMVEQTSRGRKDHRLNSLLAWQNLGLDSD